MASQTALGVSCTTKLRVLDADGNDVTAERGGVGWHWRESLGIVRTRGLCVGDTVVSEGGVVLVLATPETVFGAQR
jgi:hypothetical protein